MADMIFTPDILIETVVIGMIGAPGWTIGPLSEAMFAVIEKPAGYYAISHNRTRRRLPGMYTDRDDAFAVLAELTALLQDDDFWWSDGPTRTAELQRWRAENQAARQAIREIVGRPTYLKEILP